MSTALKTDENYNYHLSGNFAPVQDEHTAEGLEVIGEIPSDIEGHFLRIGPNPVFVPDVQKYHIFDGDGMIHQVQFSGGKAVYRNRFVNTEGLRKEREKGTWIWKGMLAMGDVFSGKEPMPAEGPFKNTANTAMVYHNDTLYALMEAAKPHAMSLPGLETLGEVDFGGKLNHPFTAHPKVDAKTGEMMTFGYSPMPPYLTYSVVDPGGNIVHTTPITIPKGVMMHDCAITENFTIFLDLPITFDFTRAMSGGSPLAWEPENGSRIGIVPRMGSDADIKWFEIDNCMVFHVANSWEEGDEVVLQASRSLHTDVMNASENVGNEDMSDQLGQLYEWRLNMKTGDVKGRHLDTANHCDFTRISDALTGYKTRYAYAARFSEDNSGRFDGELKYDDETGALQVHKFGPGRFGGEGVFAPRKGATSEDDGYVVCFVWDENTESSECVVIDAQNFEAEPVARIKIPYRVPFGFHASWVNA